MATPATPVIPGHDFAEVTFAANQPEYQPLPAIVTPDGHVVTRWQLSEEERERISQTGELWLLTMTANRPLQPILVTGLEPRVTDVSETEKRIDVL